MLTIQHINAAGFNEVIWGEDASVGLAAGIAIHSTELGPALGGIRMFAYPGRDDAIEDAKRLARAMTLKAALAGVELGGGKAVILGDPIKHKTPALLRGVGRLIKSLEGRYYGGEDAGIDVDDLRYIAQATSYVVGAGEDQGGSGDPSPTTADGVLRGMRVAVRQRLGTDDLAGLTVAIQGMGKVGRALAELLDVLGSRLIVCDLAEARTAEAARRFGARVVPPEGIFAAEADVFAPCALGGVLNARTIPRLRCAVVAGSANNQFMDEKHHPLQLSIRGILHAPDFVINAGGLIRIYVREIRHEHNLEPWMAQIPATLTEVFHSARADRPPQWVANEMAEQRLVEHCHHV